MSGNTTVKDLVDILSQNYWYLGITGSEAMANIWQEIAENRTGVEETCRELGVGMQQFVQAASLLGEWFAVSDALHIGAIDFAQQKRDAQSGENLIEQLVSDQVCGVEDGNKSLTSDDDYEHVRYEYEIRYPQ